MYKVFALFFVFFLPLITHAMDIDQATNSSSGSQTKLLQASIIRDDSGFMALDKGTVVLTFHRSNNGNLTASSSKIGSVTIFKSHYGPYFCSFINKQCYNFNKQASNESAAMEYTRESIQKLTTRTCQLYLSQ